jgi:hypothetical protein
MLKATWSVSSESDRRLLKLAIGGFFTPDDVAVFQKAVSAEIVRLRSTLAGAPHVTLCDTRGVQIQSQAAVAAFTEMLANPAARSRRLAYVVDATLARMQIKRLTARADAAFFQDPAAAEAWLFEA